MITIIEYKVWTKCQASCPNIHIGLCLQTGFGWEAIISGSADGDRTSEDLLSLRIVCQVLSSLFRCIIDKISMFPVPS